MKNMKYLTLLYLLLILSVTSCAQQNEKTNMTTQEKQLYRTLTPEEEYVIVNKGTEMPNTGEYNEFYEEGVYTCKRCDAPLYRSEDKFSSHCGWPSFDDEIEGAVKRQTDSDGRRVEILCNNCGGHLGHVFEGEGFTPKNTRHCVNSISMHFYSKDEWDKMQEAKSNDRDTAIFASGCFWGTEYHFERQEGVISTEVGYTGGHKKNPTYKEVCTGNTGHAEATRVVYNPQIVSYEELAKLFFETHDPSQLNRQGPDVGTQYRTELFYLNEEQKAIAEKLKSILEEKGLKVVTRITPASVFWRAEDYHQQYYTNKGPAPYCHIYTRRFD